MTASGKPAPVPEDGELPHWEALREGRVVFPQCATCGHLTWRLPMLCPMCRAETFAWAEVSGRGEIYTFTVVRQSWTEGFQEEIPYVIVAVAIDEQPSLLVTTDLVGDVDLNALDVGLPVAAAFEPRGDQVLLQFRLAEVTGVR